MFVSRGLTRLNMLRFTPQPEIKIIKPGLFQRIRGPALTKKNALFSPDYYQFVKFSLIWHL